MTLSSMPLTPTPWESSTPAKWKRGITKVSRVSPSFEPTSLVALATPFVLGVSSGFENEMNWGGASDGSQAGLILVTPAKQKRSGQRDDPSRSRLLADALFIQTWLVRTMSPQTSHSGGSLWNMTELGCIKTSSSTPIAR
jgi:hypothetical protein